MAPPEPAARPGRGIQVVTLVVAALALMFSLAGVGIAAFALSRSDDAVTQAERSSSRPLPGPIGTTTAPTEPTTTAEPTGDPTAGPTTSGPADLDPTAQYELAYEAERLTIRSAGCDSSRNTTVDLDRPQVGAGVENWEIAYGRCDPGTLKTNGRFVGKVAGLDATPFDCQEKIRTAPDSEEFAPQVGGTFCLFTSQNEAAAQGITQKVVFVKVDAITVDNKVGVLNVTAKAWVVPQ